MSVQVQEPIADTPLSRSLSGGSLSYLPATRQEVLADGQAATKSMASSGNDNVQSGLQGTPNICHTSPELARALSHLHKQNGERFDEITQALEQDLRDNPKSSRPSMHKGQTLIIAITPMALLHIPAIPLKRGYCDMPPLCPCSGTG